MKTTITKREFIRAFEELRPDNFSRDGLVAMFNWLEDMEQTTGEEMELDVIGTCCEFTEYENIEAFQDDYGSEYETLDDIRDVTTVIEIDDDAFIIQAF